jgi:hypothetical protein
MGGVGDFSLQRLERRALLAAGLFLEQSGQVVIEAEHFDSMIARGGKSWTPAATPAGFGGSGAMSATPNTGTQIDANIAATSPELRYAVKFATTGVYRVWLRGHIAVGTDNSAHVGVDGVAVSSADRMSAMSPDAWKWFNATMDGPAATITISAAGVHTINVWMREDGFSLDRILLTKSTTLVPSGVGATESARQTVNPTTPQLPPPPPPPVNTGLDPETDPPANIRRLTATGERAAWSPDGKKIAYIDKSFGDAWEIDVATGQSRKLTGFYANAGYLRVDYLASGDFLLTGARTFKDANTTRYYDQELWVLPADLSHAPVALNQKVNEGTALSRLQPNHIAWTETQATSPTVFAKGGTGLFTGDIVYVNGSPTLSNKKQVYFDPNYLDVQDFRDNDGEVILSRYVAGRASVYGVTLATGALHAYRDFSGEYNEAEGISPDGNTVIVESSHDQSAAHQTNQYIDLWALSVGNSGQKFRRLTRWTDYPGYKASNPVVSPDGRYIAFQSARSGETTGVGHGIFVLDLSPPAGQTIYSDDFSTVAGWQVAGSSADGSKLSVTSNGAQAVLAKSADGQTASVSITRAIDTRGYSAIALNLTAFQSSGTFEAPDKLKIEIDTGTAFERLLTDGEGWQGIDNAAGDEVSQVIGTPTPISTGWLFLQTSAANNSAVRIRITGYISAANEQYLLDALEVRGTPGT